MSVQMFLRGFSVASDCRISTVYLCRILHRCNYCQSFITTPVFETASEKYDWLNRVVAVGIGQVLPTAVAYKVYAILQVGHPQIQTAQGQISEYQQGGMPFGLGDVLALAVTSPKQAYFHITSIQILSVLPPCCPSSGTAWPSAVAASVASL